MRERTERDGAASAVAWATVIALHAVVFAWLTRAPVFSPGSNTDDDALRVEFIVRPAERPSLRGQGRDVATQRTARRPRDLVTAGTDAPPTVASIRARAQPFANAAAAATDGARNRLDLRVPEGPVRIAKDPFAREAAIEVRGTRFERAWAPDGDVLVQARFRSRAARIALGLFGGPPRRCDEVDRRLRKPDCLALSADEEEAERLRRAIE